VSEVQLQFNTREVRVGEPERLANRSFAWLASRREQTVEERGHDRNVEEPKKRSVILIAEGRLLARGVQERSLTLASSSAISERATGKEILSHLPQLAYGQQSSYDQRI
jgi:hypothetical protein